PGLLSQPLLPNEREFPAQFFSEQQKTEISLVQLLSYLLLHGVFGFPRKRSVCSLIPNDDFSCSILALCNHPFEGSILQGMIFHHDRQPFLFWVQRRTFRHRPAFQDAIEFQPEIVMKTRSLVLLHHKDERVLHALHLPFWFWLYQARLHCSHGILYHWLYDSCVAFRDKEKKPGDATTVEELIEMSESQGGERKK